MASSALSVVRQFEGLATGPRSPEIADSVSQVVPPLMFFLEHPDSLVRQVAARTMLRLSEGYSKELSALDLDRARSTMSRCHQAIDDGVFESDAEEMHNILADMFRNLELGPAPSAIAVDPPAGAEDILARGCSESTSPRRRLGQLVLRVDKAGTVDSPGPSAITSCLGEMAGKIAAIAGTFNVTMEQSYIIIGTRPAEVATDAGYLSDVLAVVKAQGLGRVTLVSSSDAIDEKKAQGGSPVDCGSPTYSPKAAEVREDEKEEKDGHKEDFDAPVCENDEFGEDWVDGGLLPYLDDKAEAGGAACGGPGGTCGISNVSSCDGSSASPAGTGGATPSRATKHSPAPLRDEAVVVSGAPFIPYLFFSSTSFVARRQLSEFQDDITVAARLAKAKRREETRRAEEKSRFAQVTRWLLGRRV